MKNNRFSILFAAMVVLLGCGDDDAPTDTGRTDTGRTDTGPGDTGRVDTGAEDTGTEDTGTEDTGTEDTGGDTGEACSTMMFDKYGMAAFVAVNNSIIDLAVAAPEAEIGTTFTALAAEGGPRVEEFRTNLANFLVLVYGGPDNYTGPTIAEAHVGLGITSDQYDYFVSDVIVPALMENGVEMDDITGCFAPPVTDPAFKAMIVEE